MPGGRLRNRGRWDYGTGRAEPPVDRPNSSSAFFDGGCDPLRGSVADVADGEHAPERRLNGRRCARSPRRQVVVGEHEPVAVERSTAGEPRRSRPRADEAEQRAALDLGLIAESRSWLGCGGPESELLLRPVSTDVRRLTAAVAQRDQAREPRRIVAVRRTTTTSLTTSLGVDRFAGRVEHVPHAALPLSGGVAGGGVARVEVERPVVVGDLDPRIWVLCGAE